MRAFIGCKLPPNVLTALGGIRSRFEQTGLNIRWVRPQGIHLTLRFLGEIDDEAVSAVKAVLPEVVAGLAPLALMAQGTGVFPGIKRPRVLWTGVGGDTQALDRVQRRLTQALARIGFEPEKRAFKAHLTVGRFKGRIDVKALAAALAVESGRVKTSFEATRLILFKSDLKPAGAVYSELGSALFSLK